jgi:hypothetical protein
MRSTSISTRRRSPTGPVTVDEVRRHAVVSLEDVFGLELEELPAEDGAGLWSQPLHEQLAAKA